ncbi:hypothetical protein ACQ4WX_04055 [Streptomyces lasalocidi]
MDTLIPGMDMRKHLVASGAYEISLCRDMVVFSSEGWFHRWRHADPLIVTCSRALLDWAIRTAVLKSLNNIEIRQARALDLLGDSERVHGVRIATVDADTPFDADFTAKYGLQLSADRGEADLYADFVVDASGRGSRIVSWLGSLGVKDIQERTLDSGLVNSTRLYRIPEGAETWPLTMIQPNPFTGGPARSGMIVPIEGHRWMVSLGGSRGGEPPKDPEAFLKYALDLPHPIVGQLIARRRAAHAGLHKPQHQQCPTLSGKGGHLAGEPGGTRRRTRHVQPALRPGHERRRPGCPGVGEDRTASLGFARPCPPCTA